MLRCRAAQRGDRRAQRTPAVARAGRMGCAHCKHRQGQFLPHVARAFSLGGPATSALLRVDRGVLGLLGCSPEDGPEARGHRALPGQGLGRCSRVPAGCSGWLRANEAKEVFVQKAGRRRTAGGPALSALRAVAVPGGQRL